MAVACILFTGLPAEAQLRYGIRLGGVFAKSSLKDAGSLSIDNGSGFSGGLTLEYQLQGCGLAADIAALYTRYSTSITDATGDRHRLGGDFIEIPIHLKYKFWLPAFHNLFGPMVYTGPSFMIGLGDRKTSFDAPWSSSTPPSAMTFSRKSFLPGWDAGIGFDIVNFLQIAGGYRFSLGNSSGHSAELPDARLRTDGWNISATLLFDF